VDQSEKVDVATCTVTLIAGEV